VNVLIAAAILGWLSLRGNMAPITELLKPSDANLGERIAFGNLVLAAFNLLPAYPMDGGRVLRGLLARWKTEEQATEIAARTGRMFAILMGLFGLLSSNFLLMFIALFVYLGAAQEGAAVRGRLLTTGYKVRAAMVTDFRTLPHGASIRDAGDLLLATSQHDFPVVYGDRVIGLLGRSALIRAMLQQGPDAYVSSAMDREFTRVSPEQDLSEAMPMVSGTGGCALVMEGDQILGMLTAENLSEFLLLRQVSETQARLHAH
jgi:CBS domain-containing protein